MVTIPRIVSAAPQSDHRLLLRFDDGVEGSVDLGTFVTFSGVFAALADPAFFATVEVDPEAGTVVWSNGADLDPIVLHDLVTEAIRVTGAT